MTEEKYTVRIVPRLESENLGYSVIISQIIGDNSEEVHKKVFQTKIEALEYMREFVIDYKKFMRGGCL